MELYRRTVCFVDKVGILNQAAMVKGHSIYEVHWKALMNWALF